MTLRARLAQRRSKEQTVAIARSIGSDRERFSELLSIFFGSDRILAQRAAWILSYCAEFEPTLVEPHLSKLIDQLMRDDVHDAVKRSVVRLFESVEIPKKLAGKLFSICIDLLDDPKQSIAIRVFAMSAAFKAASGQPDLLNELRLITQTHLPHSTAGFRARAKNLFGRDFLEH